MFVERHGHLTLTKTQKEMTASQRSCLDMLLRLLLKRASRAFEATSAI
jgi:hypothetical protein